MPKQTDTLPAIRSITLKELVINPLLSGRSQKEITTNAKSLAPAMEAFGWWDASQPGEFFVRDGTKHLLSGFTRVAACAIAGIKTGCFTEKPDAGERNADRCLQTNRGCPISQFEQGRRFISRRNGTDLTQPQPIGAVIYEPMSAAEIAASEGYSRQHVEDCIGIFEETNPEIRQLLEDEKISAGVAVRAKQLEKADGKRLALLKSAVANAKQEGRDKATGKDLRAVAPLKADKPAKATKKTTAPEPEKKPDAPSKPAPQSVLDLGKPKAKLSPDRVRQTMIDVMESTLDDLEAADAERLADALIKAGFGIVSANPL